MPSTRSLVRIFAVTAAVTTAGVGVGACGGGGAAKPSAAQIEARLKADPTDPFPMSSLTGSQQSCVAAAVQKNVSASQLNKWVDKKIDAQQVSGNESGLESALKGCKHP